MQEERWIGERARIGIAIPSTNIAVEYDCQRIIPEGVTWHFGRFYIEVRDLSDNETFLKFVEAIQDTIPLSMRDLVTAEITYAMMGMSAETFWGGKAGNDAFQQRIREIRERLDCRHTKQLLSKKDLEVGGFFMRLLQSDLMIRLNGESWPS